MADQRSMTVSPKFLNGRNKGRKRKVNLREWSRNVRKYRRNTGQPYIGHRNTPKPGKVPCEEMATCKCPYQCKNLSKEDYKILFEKFYLMDYNQQTHHLAAESVELVDIKRRSTSEAVSRRHCTFKYYVRVQALKIQVCQQTLCRAYGITPRRLQKLQEKIKNGKSLDDGRGRHENRPNKLKDTIKDAIRKHINQLPKQESHYSRHKSGKLCFRPDLSISKVYEMFKAENPEISCSERAYRDVFNGEFNLSFGLPRSDCCAYCDKLYIQLTACDTEEERKKIEMESTLHHRRAEEGYKQLQEDKDKAMVNEDYVVLCTDMQQVLYCPTVNHSAVFHQRQLSTYNQAVHNLGDNSVNMFVWPETVAKRGSGEVTATLLKYIISTSKPLERGRDRALIVWSDRCIGQNNNWRTIALYQYLVSLQYFTSVEQKFLISGHSFLPCDRDFALIERNKKNYVVYEPFEWVQVIATARLSNSFLASYMTREDFVDISIIESGLRKPPLLKITQYVWFKISSDSPTVLQCRKSHNVLQPWYSENVAKRSPGRASVTLPPVVVSLNNLPYLHNEELGVSAEKKKDLIDISKYIPEKYRPFYENLRPTTE